MKIIEIMTGVEKLVTRNVAAGKRIHQVCLLGFACACFSCWLRCRGDAVSAADGVPRPLQPTLELGPRRYTFRGRPFLIKTITTSRCKQDACVWLFDYGVDKAGTFFYHTRLKGFHQEKRGKHIFPTDGPMTCLSAFLIIPGNSTIIFWCCEPKNRF